jgi:hypothetical protein
MMTMTSAVKSFLAYELGADLERLARGAGAVIAMVYAAGLLAGEWLHRLNGRLAGVASAAYAKEERLEAIKARRVVVAPPPVVASAVADEATALPVVARRKPVTKRNRKRTACQ